MRLFITGYLGHKDGSAAYSPCPTHAVIQTVPHDTCSCACQLMSAVKILLSVQIVPPNMFNNTYACQVEPAVKSDSWSCCHTSTTCAVTHCGATATSSCLKFLCLVQMVKTGAVKDDAQGENILGKISNLRPHPTHLLLANLKAEQEMNLNRPHEVLKTVRPFLSSSERCCWALNKALWAHWVTGNLPEVRLPTWCFEPPTHSLQCCNDYVQGAGCVCR